MKTIINNQDRSVLNEGRNSGMGFAFLKQKSKFEFETVQPPSPCKDYLNEVVFTENTGVPTKAHGFVYSKKLDIFDASFYLAINIVKSKADNFSYTGYSFESLQKSLKTNYKNMEYFINYFEKELNLKKSKFQKTEGDEYIFISGSKAWVKSTIAISLYSLLVRASISYTDRSMNPLQFLKNKLCPSPEVDLITQIIPALEQILSKKELPNQPKTPEPLEAWWSPHEIGILNERKRLIFN